jgi:hypothetical protein
MTLNVVNAEQGRATEHRGEGLGVTAGRRNIQMDALLLKVTGRYPDIEADIAEIVRGLAEIHLRDGGAKNSWSEQRSGRSTSGDQGGAPGETRAIGFCLRNR